MDMDSNIDAVTRGRCRVCLEKDVDVVALSLPVYVFSEKVTLSHMLKTCCAIKISTSDLKPQTLCSHCAKQTEQSFIFRTTCQKADVTLQEELDGVNMKIETNELIIKEDHQEELDGDDNNIELDELIIKEDHEDDDYKKEIVTTVKGELPECVSILNADLTQFQSKQDTSSIEKIVCKICITYFADWISLEHHLENCYKRICGVCGQTFTSDDTLNEHELTHITQNTDKQVVLKQRKKLKCHKCRYCKMCYKFPTELRCHLMTHTAIKHYLCLFCGKKFSIAHRSKCERTHTRHSRAHLVQDTDSKANEASQKLKRFGCAVCKKSYHKQSALMKHKCINTSKDIDYKYSLRKHAHARTDKKSYECSIYIERFAQLDYLKRHKLTHPDDKPYQCSNCNKRYSKRSYLKRHEHTHTGHKPYECSHCSKRFITQAELTVHIRIHTGEKPYKCSHCSKRFMRLGDIITHERIHTGEKPYECSHCSKKFNARSALVNHERTHTGEKPYECSHCKKRFSQRSNLTTHELVHTGKKTYECSYCGKGYAQLSYLNIHKLTHTGEKPHKCSLCSKRFTSQRALNVHIRTHTGEKPYECSHCNKRFSQRSNIVVHERLHTGEKPYRCSHCRKCFADSRDLTKHKRTHNGENP